MSLTTKQIDELRAYAKDRKGELAKLINDAADTIEMLSAKQPERKKGKWVNGKCDKCGCHAPYWCLATTYYKSNYCPNCGAKMEEGENE